MKFKIRNLIFFYRNVNCTCANIHHVRIVPWKTITATLVMHRLTLITAFDENVQHGKTVKKSCF